jgi:hypothetical protein
MGLKHYSRKCLITVTMVHVTEDVRGCDTKRRIYKAFDFQDQRVRGVNIVHFKTGHGTTHVTSTFRPMIFLRKLRDKGTETRL